jgi:hypothetical protein
MIETQTVSSTDDHPRQTPKAPREFPGLCEFGLRPPPRSAPTAVRADQVATAMAYLRQFRPIKKGSYSSYHLKHLAENWGNKNGLSFYISNGALITAALLLGLVIQPFRSLSPNAKIGISKRDYKKLAGMG